MNIEFTGDYTQYLGDAVYASWDGYCIWLETSNGLEITNRIALEPKVFENLLAYKDWLDGVLAQKKEKQEEENEVEF